MLADYLMFDRNAIFLVYLWAKRNWQLKLRFEMSQNAIAPTHNKRGEELMELRGVL
jgi:hypothetical protein